MSQQPQQQPKWEVDGEVLIGCGVIFLIALIAVCTTAYKIAELIWGGS